MSPENMHPLHPSSQVAHFIDAKRVLPGVVDTIMCGCGGNVYAGILSRTEPEIFTPALTYYLGSCATPVSVLIRSCLHFSSSLQWLSRTRGSLYKTTSAASSAPRSFAVSLECFRLHMNQRTCRACGPSDARKHATSSSLFFSNARSYDTGSHNQ